MTDVIGGTVDKGGTVPEGPGLSGAGAPDEEDVESVWGMRFGEWRGVQGVSIPQSEGNRVNGSVVVSLWNVFPDVFLRQRT